MRDNDNSGVDLWNSINLEEVQCLNEDEDNMGKSILKLREDMLDKTKFLQSPEGDPELLMYVPFVCPVKIHTISIIPGGGGTTPN